MALRKVLIGQELELAHSSTVLGAVRIALERALVRRPIQRVEEGRADSKHVEDFSQHLECTRSRNFGATSRNSHAIEKSPVKSQKVHAPVSLPCQAV